MSDIVYSRTNPRIEAVETYSYTCEMDANPSFQPAGTAAYVDMVLPLAYFRPYHRRLDLLRGILQRNPAASNIGRLLMRNLPPQTTTIPPVIDIIIPPAPPPGRLSEVLYRTQPYDVPAPDTAPWQWPFQAIVEVSDEIPIARALARSHDPADNLITRDGSFTSGLVLEFHVQVAVPRACSAAGFTPALKLLQVDWPFAASYSAISACTDSGPHPLRYNAQRSQIECKDVPLRRVPARFLKATEQDLRVFETPGLQMCLLEPCGLQHDRPLRARLELELPGCLLSGAEVDFFEPNGAAWRSAGKDPLVRKSVIKLEMNIHLRERFRRRLLSPLYELYFDGLCLDEEKLQAIENILRGLGFHCQGPRIRSGVDRSTIYEQHYTHSGLYNDAQLWVQTTGTKKTTIRETSIPNGRIYTSPVETGSTQIDLRAELRGDPSTINDLLNQIHLALENHFRYMIPPD